MRFCYLSVVLFCVGLQPCCAQTYARAEMASLSGRVLYKDGSPVRDAEVEVHTFAPVGAILPEPVHTDANGRYSTDYPPLGRGVISASKPLEGYPNREWALYASKSNSVRPIDLQPGSRLHDVDLQFGEPNQVVEFIVVNMVTDSPVRNAQLYVAWLNKPEIMVSLTIPPTGRFAFVVPKEAVKIEISAPGYLPWVYKENNDIYGSTSGLRGGKTGSKQIQVSLRAK